MSEFQSTEPLPSEFSAPHAMTFDAAIRQARQLAECTLCFDGLCEHPCASLHAADRSRSCPHYFHLHCLNRLSSRICNLCDVTYDHAKEIPNAILAPSDWFDAIDVDGDGNLSYEEVIEGLKTALPLDWTVIEGEADRNWIYWDHDQNGNISKAEFASQSSGLFLFMREHYPRAALAPPPDITVKGNRRDWFSYWDEDNSDSLERGELVRALIKTFRIARRSTDSIPDTVAAVWDVFDSDGNGTISFIEFDEIDGLADTLLAQLSFETGGVEALRRASWDARHADDALSVQLRDSLMAEGQV